MSIFAGSLETSCPWCLEDVEIFRITLPSVSSSEPTVGWHCVHDCDGEYDFFKDAAFCPWCQKAEKIWVRSTREVADESKMKILGWHAIHFCSDHYRNKMKDSQFVNKKILEIYDEANKEDK